MTRYLSLLYFLFGIIFLLTPLIYIELGRPRDLIKAGLNLVIGMLLIFKYKIFDGLYSSILFVITILFIFYLVEIFTIRWNQLTNQEKNKLRTIVEFKKNVSIFLDAISLARKNLFNLNNSFKFGKNNENKKNKKWVMNNKNDSMIISNTNKLRNVEMQKKATIEFKKDTIDDEK